MAVFNSSFVGASSCIRSQSAGGSVPWDGRCKESCMIFTFTHKKQLRNDEYEVLLIDERTMTSTV